MCHTWLLYYIYNDVVICRSGFTTKIPNSNWRDLPCVRIVGKVMVLHRYNVIMVIMFSMVHLVINCIGDYYPCYYHPYYYHYSIFLSLSLLSSSSSLLLSLFIFILIVAVNVILLLLLSLLSSFSSLSSLFNIIIVFAGIVIVTIRHRSNSQVSFTCEKT